MASTTPDELLTMQQAADALGVHYMTVYRYVRHGRLPARREGAEWRISRRDVERFANRDAAPRPARRGKADPAEYVQRVFDRLVAGDETGAWAVCESAIAAGMEPSDIYLRVLGPAMIRVGDDWAAGRLDIAEEHRATAVLMRIIGRLGPRFTRRGRSLGTVIAGSAAGDYHALPVAMLADLLRHGGYTVMDLGANVPADTFVKAIGEADRLVAVGIGVASDAARESARLAIDAIRAGYPGTFVLLGGPAIASSEDAAALGADAFAADGAQAVELIHAARKRS